MSVIVTSVARVNDWQAVTHAWRALYQRRAAQWSACRFGLYRNVHDASLVLVLSELPDLETLSEMGDRLGASLRALTEPNEGAECIWEAMDTIGGIERRHSEPER